MQNELQLARAKERLEASEKKLEAQVTALKSQMHEIQLALVRKTEAMADGLLEQSNRHEKELEESATRLAATLRLQRQEHDSLIANMQASCNPLMPGSILVQPYLEVSTQSRLGIIMFESQKIIEHHYAGLTFCFARNMGSTELRKKEGGSGTPVLISSKLNRSSSELTRVLKYWN